MTRDTLSRMQDVPIAVPGGEINVWRRRAAEGAPTAVLVHGLTGNSRWFRRVIERMPADVGVAAMDVRGRGGSVGAPPPYDLTTLADDIAICLDHLGLAQATIVGYSMGAWITSIFATRHPERVGRLLLLDGGLKLPTDPEARPDEIIEAMVGPSLARLGLHFEDHEAYLDLWREHPALEAYWEDEMGAALDHELAPDGSGLKVVVDPDAVREAARQITVDPETDDAAAGVPVPTMLIVVERGTADQPGGMVPLDVARRAEERNPNLTVRYLEGLNHYTLVLGAGAPTVADAITRV